MSEDAEDTPPVALSLAAVRQEMVRGIRIPPEIVNKALATTVSKLEARETKFFSYKGRVTQSVEVEDHTTQLAAADQIFSLSGLYAREREAPRSTPHFSVEADMNTGVIRIVSGDAPPALPPARGTIDTNTRTQRVSDTGISDEVWSIIEAEELPEPSPQPPSTEKPTKRIIDIPDDD